MNNGDKNIDKLFKDAFGSTEYPVNDALWKDALATLPTSKPKKTLWWIMAVVSAVLISAVTFVFQPFSSNELAQFEERNQWTSFSDFSMSNDNNPKSQTSTITDIDRPTSSSVSTQKPSKTKLEGITPLNNNSNISTSNSSTIPISEPTFSEKISSTSNAGNSAPARNVNAASVDVNISQEENTRTSENALSLFSVYDFNSLENRSSENPQEKMDSRKPKFYGPGVLRLSAGFADATYFSVSESTPSIMYSGNQLNVELSYEHMLSPHWGIQGGIQFSKWEEQQSTIQNYEVDNSYIEWIDQSYWDYFETEVILTDSTWWLGGWYYYDPYSDSLLDSTYVQAFDSNLVIQIDTLSENLKASQRITYLEFPLLATYNFGWNRWTMQVASGISFGVFLNSRGNVIQPGDPAKLVATGKDLFQSLQFNYLLSTELGYSLNPNWQVFARPQAKVNLNSALDSNYSPSRKALFLGGNLGVAYRF